jgi:hypothetical protein
VRGLFRAANAVTGALIDATPLPNLAGYIPARLMATVVFLRGWLSCAPAPNARRPTRHLRCPRGQA